MTTNDRRDLLAERERRGWTLCDAARRLGLAPRALEAIECGQVVPGRRVLARLRAGYGIEVVRTPARPLFAPLVAACVR